MTITVKRVVILGAGGHGQVVADILLATQRAGHVVVPVGFLDDNTALHGSSFLGLPVLGSMNALTSLDAEAVVVAVGDNARRQSLFAQASSAGMTLANAIHPSAVIAPDVHLGRGVMVCAGAIVNTGSIIGDGVILNTACSVDHHNRIGDFAHVAPGSHLGGGVSIGEGALIGIGCVVLPGTAVGDWAVVGAGSTVIRAVPDHCTAVGSPARLISPRVGAE